MPRGSPRLASSSNHEARSSTEGLLKRNLTIGVVAFLSILIASAYLGGMIEHHSRARFPSSFAPEPEGLLAFRRLLVETGVPTAIGLRPWDDLASKDPSGLMIVASPLQRDVDDREALGIRSWLLAGGALLFVDDATAIERSDRLDQLMGEAGLETRFPLPELDKFTLMPGRPRTHAAHGTPAVPAGRDLQRLVLNADGGLLPGAVGTPLAISESNAIVTAEGRIGAGRVVRVLGGLLANDRLLAGDDLTFALRLVADLRGNGPVIFDEYHHGYGGLLPAIRGLDRAALAWAALQAAAAALLYAAARGTRFGPVRPEQERLRRSSLEFVRSMAALYWRGGCRRHALESLMDRFTRDARARFGLPEALGSDRIAQACASHTGLPEPRVRATLDAVHEAILSTSLTDRRMLQRAADLDRLEKEISGGSR